MTDNSKFKVRGGSHSLATLINLKPSNNINNIPVNHPSSQQNTNETIKSFQSQPDNKPTPPSSAPAPPPPPPRRASITGDGSAPPPPPPPRRASILEDVPVVENKPIPPVETKPVPPTKPLTKPILTDFPPSPSEAVSNSTSVATPTSTTNKLKSVTNNTPKCNICDKTVYKMEEVQALNKLYHKSCFKCGGHNSDGCNKVLTLDKYTDHDNEPYCNNCYGKLFRPKGYGYSNTLQLDSTSNDKGVDIPATSNSNSTISPSNTFVKPQLKSISSNSKVISSDNKPINAPSKTIPPSPVNINTKPNIPSPVTKQNTTNKPNTLVAPKCTICASTVYKMEEVQAVGHVWHKTCFKCGGHNSDGCSKVLTLDKYCDHDNEPYCNNCYDKLFRPKGYGYSNTLQLDSNRSNDNSVNKLQQNLQSASISKTTGSISKASKAIGSKGGALHTEAAFVGDGDEVDEGEW
eukprot:gene17959-23589_t